MSNSLLKPVFHERREGGVSKTHLKAKKAVKRNRIAIEPSCEKPILQGYGGIVARSKIGLLCGLHLPFSSAPL